MNIKCPSCEKTYKKNPSRSDDDIIITSDPAKWILEFSMCPVCYDKAHGGNGKMFEPLCKKQELFLARG